MSPKNTDVEEKEALPADGILDGNNEEFDDIECDGWDEASKEAGRTPLDPGDYGFQVKSYELVKTKKLETRAMLKCTVVNDLVPENNGRVVFLGLMLQGRGFSFALDFAEAVDRKFSGKTKIVTKREDGVAYSPWIDTWIGAYFIGTVAIQKDLVTGEPTNFNEITKFRKMVV